MALAITFTSCNQEKLEKLQSDNQTLSQEKQRQDSVLNEMLATFNQFEDNLREIKQRENLVTSSAAGGELDEDGKDRILGDIQLINELLAENRQIVSDLTTQLESAEGTSSQLRRTVARFRRQLEERDAEVNTLKEQLATLNMEIEDLNGRVDTLSQINTQLATLRETQASQIEAQESQIESQTETISAQTEAMNTVFYIVGESRDLKRSGILDGRRMATSVDNSSFTRIDRRDVTSIPLGVRKADLVTPHPSDSYTLVEEGNEVVSLEITNTDRFWQATKYLVVEIR